MGLAAGAGGSAPHRLAGPGAVDGSAGRRVERRELRPFARRIPAISLAADAGARLPAGSAPCWRKRPSE